MSTPTLPVSSALDHDDPTLNIGEQHQSASNARLPDMDALSSFASEVQPGMVPLLVKMPDGLCEQVDVPVTSTIDEVKMTLQRYSTGGSGPSDDDNLRLSFNNIELDPSATLLDTHIADAYEHAGSLLQIINNASHDANTKTAALDSACAVVERISNGIKDMEALCEAAANSGNSENNNNNINDNSGTVNKDSDIKNEGQHHQQQQKNITQQDAVDGDVDANNILTPSALANTLTRRLPNLFPATQKQQQQQQQQPQPQQQITQIPEQQPTISSIRDMRRKARANSGFLPAADLSSANDDDANDNIGYSTYSKQLPTDLNNEGATKNGDDATNDANAAIGTGSGINIMLAQSGRTTWLEDVMKTIEVNTVRQSGVLEKSKDGQVVNQYLDGLEAEAMREALHEEIDPDLDPEDPSGEISNSAAGNTNSDSNDNQTTTTATTSASTATPSSSNNHMVQNSPINVTMSTAQSSTSNLIRSSATTTTEASATTTASNPQNSVNSNPISASFSVPSSTLPTGPVPNLTINGILSPGAPATPSSSTTSGSSCAPQRRATKIAPAPTPTSLAAGANGLPPHLMFQGCPPPPGTWARTNPPPGQKKRGRKRKNPELTEEERALVRKEQNRESARLSRVRRKVIAAEYEGKLNELIGENSLLRKQVEALNNRLVYLQSILTVSVRPGDPNGQNA